VSDNQRVGFTPATPRSKRLGRELRRLRDEAKLRLEDAGKLINSSPSRIQRIEAGDIKARPGDVMELLEAYGIPRDDERAVVLVDMARRLKDTGWWQRFGDLPPKYATFIAYEAEAIELHNYEPTLVPGLLQTEDYTRAVVSVGREADAAGIEERVRARMERQAVLTRSSNPLRLYAVMSEAALRVEVGGPEILRNQLRHIVEVSQRLNVTVQVLTFKAGAHLSDRGGFAIIRLAQDDPPLGYAETPAGALFLEAPAEVDRLSAVFDDVRTRALSPAESVAMIKELANEHHEVAKGQQVRKQR
jgi:transcriptional regulator with XRE-family HTH domain